MHGRQELRKRAAYMNVCTYIYEYMYKCIYIYTYMCLYVYIEIATDESGVTEAVWPSRIKTERGIHAYMYIYI